MDAKARATPVNIPYRSGYFPPFIIKFIEFLARQKYRGLVLKRKKLVIFFVPCCMELTATTNGGIYPFNVSLFEDNETEQYNYLIQFSDQPPIVVQKDIASGNWFSIPAGVITGDLEEAIFAQIDKSNFETLSSTVVYPIEQLNQHYLNSL